MIKFGVKGSNNENLTRFFANIPRIEAWKPAKGLEHEDPMFIKIIKRRKDDQNWQEQFVVIIKVEN